MENGETGFFSLIKMYSVIPSLNPIKKMECGLKGLFWDFTYLFRAADLHCNENLIYVFPEKELCGLSTNFRIHVSVSDLYIPGIGPHIFLQQNRQTNRGNI